MRGWRVSDIRNKGIQEFGVELGKPNCVCECVCQSMGMLSLGINFELSN